jgi:hypothetical protein
MTTVKQNWLRLPKSVRQLFLKKGVDEDSVPHDRTWDLWKVVGEDCGLSHGQTMKIINFLFTSTEVQFDGKNIICLCFICDFDDPNFLQIS